MSSSDQELIRWIILASFLMPLLLASILIWFLLAFQRKKHQHEVDLKDAQLREQALIIGQKELVEQERGRIASEMHDDMGSGLTTIRYLSDKALRYARTPEEKTDIQKIADRSNALVQQMSEIIWAMTGRYDNTESLTSHLRHYAVSYLEEFHLPLEFEMLTGDQTHAMSGEKRRNIFLVFKETLHNTIKYAQSSRVRITIENAEVYAIHIFEIGGRGFSPADPSIQGNGLYNCQKRMNAIGGSIVYTKLDDGMAILIRAPFS